MSVNGYELPEGSFEADENGMITAFPTILLTGTNASAGHLNPQKWVSTNKQYRIVYAESEMDPAYSSIPYLLRQDRPEYGTEYCWVDTVGDVDVPVYSELPEPADEGTVIACNGRKYRSVIKPVAGRYYTNIITHDQIILNKRVNSSNNLVDSAGSVVITNIRIPDDIMAKARNGAVITIRFTDISLSKLTYTANGKQVASLATSQVYMVKDGQSDSNVSCFYLYYKTNMFSEASNAYNAACAKADTFSISGTVSSTVLPNDYDKSHLEVTIEEVIAETEREKLVWEDIGAYVKPVYAHWRPTANELLVADGPQGMTDVGAQYVNSEDGCVYMYRDYMNALLRHPDGNVRYYVAGVPTYAGIVRDMDGFYYYINSTKYAVRNVKYSIGQGKANGLITAGTYTFDNEGHIVDLPEVIDNTDPTDIRNGLLRFADGSVRFVKDAIPQYAGVVRDAEGYYYYVNSTTYAVRDQRYTFSQARANGLITAGAYTFDGQGHIVDLPQVIDGSDPNDIRNGLLRFSDGSVRYVINAIPQYAGIVRDAEGYYYYVNSTRFAVRSQIYDFSTTRANGLLPGGVYRFDDLGHIVDVPVVIDDSDPTDLFNGLLRFGDGTVRYVVNGLPQQVGMVMDRFGYYYYIDGTKKAVTDLSLILFDTNGLQEEGQRYVFGEDGRMLDTTIPAYWENEVAATIERVNALKAQSSNTISFTYISDMHVDTVQRQYAAKNVGLVSNKIMNACDIPYMFVVADNNTQAAIAANTPDHIYADIAMQNSFLQYVGWNRVVRIMGNHDGQWGRVGGYYNQCLPMEDKVEMIYQKSAEAQKKVGTDAHYDEGEDSSWYYINDNENKIRYIMLNSHWASYTVDENYYPTHNPFRGSYYGPRQLQWLANEALDMEEGWTAAIFTHIPPITRYSPITGVNQNVYTSPRDQYLMIQILNAYATKSAYYGYYDNSAFSWANVTISVDYSTEGGNEALGEICGVFSGHSHTDYIDNENWPFPVITVLASGNMPRDEATQVYYDKDRRALQGPDQETSFDVVVIDRDTKTVYLTRVGDGEDRVATYGN
jgi:hypothetical protein